MRVHILNGKPKVQRTLKAQIEEEQRKRKIFIYFLKHTFWVTKFSIEFPHLFEHRSHKVIISSEIFEKSS